MQIASEHQGSDVKHRFRVLRRLWPVVATLTVLSGVLGFVLTPERADPDGTRYFRATNSLILVDTPDGRPDGVLQQAALRATSGEVPDRVAAELGMDLEDVTSRVQAESRVDMVALHLTGISNDPEEAAMLANTTASHLVAYLTEEDQAAKVAARDGYFTRLDSLTEQVLFLDGQIAAAATQTDADLLRAERDAAISQLMLVREGIQQLASEGEARSGFKSIEAAVPVEISKKAFRNRSVAIAAGVQPIKTGAALNEAPQSEAVESPGDPADPFLYAAFAAVLGFIAGVAAAFVLDRLDNRIHLRSDAEHAFGLEVITEIPSFTREQHGSEDVLASTDSRSQFAEAYRLVRTSVLYLTAAGNAGDEGPARSPVVLVTSPSPEDGKTTTVVNLAAVLAETGMSVLVVNCDFRRPRIHRFLSNKGSSVIHDTSDLQFVDTGIKGVRMVTNVRVDPDANPAEVIARQREIVRAAKNRFDIILLDTAPFLTTNDAAELLPEADLVLLVAQAGKTRQDSAARTTELLKRLGANIAGVVITNSATAPVSDYYYYYLSDGGDNARTKRRRKRNHQERVDQASEGVETESPRQKVNT